MGEPTKEYTEQRVSIQPGIGAQFHCCTINPVNLDKTFFKIENKEMPHLWAVTLSNPCTVMLDTREIYNGKPGENIIHVLITEFEMAPTLEQRKANALEWLQTSIRAGSDKWGVGYHVEGGYVTPAVFDTLKELLTPSPPVAEVQADDDSLPCVSCGKPSQVATPDDADMCHECFGQFNAAEYDLLKKQADELVKVLTDLEKLGTCWQGQGVMGSQLFIMGTAIASPCREALQQFSATEI